ncbi:MAG: hypothetical protein ACRDTA_28795 [Pseudonocardiaceae bacterium]
MTETVQHEVTLAGARVRLREFRIDDLDDSDAILGDNRVTRWLSFDSKPASSKPRCARTAPHFRRYRSRRCCIHRHRRPARLH